MDLILDLADTLVFDAMYARLVPYSHTAAVAQSTYLDSSILANDSASWKSLPVPA